ncbi:MAG: site-2 protease family protein [Clostridia bacterium]|nr:site-2 protease family protein [Clostridia bacterium]MBR5713744.1 site-2 protease family protein [Clostridia bacterium]MBR5719181.1 site-2 protease family protein [Clostridia bacterium]
MLLSLLMSDADMTTKLMYVVFELIVIMVSLSFHEWAHAYAAHRMGDDTALNMGRMTLNPVAHIDPLGILALLFIGFGWAKPVPVNPRNYREYRKGEFIVSFAGIFMNLMLALFAALLAVAVAVYDSASKGIPIRTEVIMGLSLYRISLGNLPESIYMFLYMLGITNCALAVFNFIPVYPLDGAHIFELVFGKTLGARAVMWLRNNGRIILYVFIGLSFLLSNMGISFSLIGGVSSWLLERFVSLFAMIVGLFV